MGPTLVSYPLTQAAYDYVMRVLSLGIYEGPIGDMQFAKDIEPVLEALHTVLSGGTVTVTIEHRGSPDIKRELDERMLQMGRDSNEINKKAGYYVTAYG